MGFASDGGKGRGGRASSNGGGGPRDGGAGRGGGGARGGKGGGGPSAGPDRAMGGRGSPDRSLGERLGDLFGGKPAYDRAKAARASMFGGRISVPSIPNASTGQIVSGILGATSLSPMGVGLTIGNELKNFAQGNPPGSSMVQGFVDKLTGETPGKIEGSIETGRINGQADPGGGKFSAPWMPTKATPATPATTPASEAITPHVFKSRAPWMMNQTLLPGPSRYGFLRPVPTW